MIPNPNYFEDLEPYKMTPIVSKLLVFMLEMKYFEIQNWYKFIQFA